MVIYLPVKFEFDWTKRFQVRVRNGNVDRQTEKKIGQTHRRNYTNFESNLATMVIYLSVNSEFDWTKHFRV